MVFKTQFVYVIVLHSLLLPSSGCRARTCKIDQIDFTDWVSFRPAKPMDKTNLYENFKFEKCYIYDDFLSS